MNNVLEIKNYSKVYSGNKKAVDSLNLKVKAGEIHAFIGHNGAGKTTTIRAVVGIMDFDEGEILVNDHSVKDEPVKCKSMTAYIPDNPDLYDYITGIQYLNYMCDMFSVPAKERVSRIQKICRCSQINGQSGGFNQLLFAWYKTKACVDRCIYTFPTSFSVGRAICRS